MVEPQPFQLKTFIPSLLVTLAFLFGGELVLRIPFVRNVLPLPRIYYTNSVETRLRALQDTQRANEEIDVLFIGSSIVRTNIRPLMFDEVVSELAQEDVVSFNGGLSGLPPDAVRLYFENVWLKHSAPQVVIHGVRYSELEDVQSGYVFEEFENGLLERRWMENSPVARFEASILENSQLFYYAGTMTRTLQNFKLPLNRPQGQPVDSRGYSVTNDGLHHARAQGLALQSYVEAFDAQRFAAGLDVLQTMSMICEQENITYIVVNIPEHSDRYVEGTDGEARYASYLMQLAQAAEESGFYFIDVTDEDVYQYSDDALFSDYWHMSPAGAERFTRELATRWLEYRDTILQRD